ncbi:MAG: fimbrillin family protein, partial [Acetatifactor sp.]|nr:fimbrillin family protein [Acetatifactor sp.]
MKHTAIQHISSLIGVGALLFAGCTDDILYDDRTDFNNSDLVTFTAGVSPADAFSTRGGGPLYDPLVLTGEDEEYPLYLHTWEHPWDEPEPVAETDTRGLQVQNVKDLHDIHKSFGVQASLESDGSSYISMSGTKMLPTGNQNIWTTENPNRWPGDNRLTFGAVAPYNHLSYLKNPVYGKNSISFSYEAMKGDGTNDAEKQVDLLMATATMNREEAKPHNHRVPLQFNHALSAIKFAVRDVLKGEVVSISIEGINCKGDCVYKADDSSENGSFEWKNQSGICNYTQLFNHKIENGNFDPTDESQDRLLTDAMPEKTFMVIPQEIPDDATIKIVIKRDNVASGLKSEITVKGKIKANGMDEWKAGHEYVYTVSTSKDNWVYVLDAEGNEAGGKENIFVYNPNDQRFDNSGNIAEYYVTSYRYKANDQNYVEALPWKASHGGSYSYKVGGTTESAYPAGNPEQRFVSAENWL